MRLRDCEIAAKLNCKHMEVYLARQKFISRLVRTLAPSLNNDYMVALQEMAVALGEEPEDLFAILDEKTKKLIRNEVSHTDRR